MTDLGDNPNLSDRLPRHGQDDGRARAGRHGLDSTGSTPTMESSERAGKSIAAIFAEDGEPAFRDLEAAVVAELARRRRTVVALGGGAVLREANRHAIRAAGPVVWLTASVDTILERLAADESTASRRPNLTTIGGRAEIETVTRRSGRHFTASVLRLSWIRKAKRRAEVADEIVGYKSVDARL